MAALPVTAERGGRCGGTAAVDDPAEEGEPLEAHPDTSRLAIPAIWVAVVAAVAIGGGGDGKVEVVREEKSAVLLRWMMTE